MYKYFFCSILGRFQTHAMKNLMVDFEKKNKYHFLKNAYF